MQLKFVQNGTGCEIGEQMLPHRPQLKMSVRRFLQVPLQQLWSAGHATGGTPQKLESLCVSRHWKSRQVGWSAGQTAPHAPQFWLSRMRTVLHVPLQHCWSAGVQALPQAPQLSGSDVRSRQLL